MTNRLFRSLPSDPRCKLCQAPYGGVAGSIMTARRVELRGRGEPLDTWSERVPAAVS